MVAIRVKCSMSCNLAQRIIPTGPNDRNPEDNFGFAIAMDGLWAVVGAPYHDYDYNGNNYKENAGAVYVYKYSELIEEWEFVQKITATGLNARNANDRFGIAVAISGDTLAVGANTHDYDEAGINPIANAGAVFIYRLKNGIWTPRQKVVPTGTNARHSGCLFGSAIALQGDVLAVSTGDHDYNLQGGDPLANAGAAWVFERTEDTYWQNTKLIEPHRHVLAYFGIDIAINDDGTMLAIGSFSQGYNVNGGDFKSGAGAVNIFARGESWEHVQKIVPTGTNARNANDNFGCSVAIYGNVLAVGACNHDYDAAGGNYLGAAGAVWTFTYNGTWTQADKIVAFGTNGRMQGDNFGSQVAVDNDFLAVTAIRQGYDSDGNNFVDDAGAVFTFNYVTDSWAAHCKYTGIDTGNDRRAYAYFGQGLAVSQGRLMAGGLNGDDPIGSSGSLGGAGIEPADVSGGGALFYYVLYLTSGSSISLSSSFSSSSEIPFQGLLLSSCEPYEYADRGRDPIAVAQKLGHEYPLVRPSANVRYLIADAYLNFDDPADYDSTLTEYKLPFSIKWLYGFGCEPAAKPSWAPSPTHYADVLIVDADGRTVFDSTTGTHKRTNWTDWLDVHEWRTDDAIFRLVQHTKWQEDSVTPQDYPVHLVPDAAVLDERVVERQPKRLKSITVGLQKITGSIIEIQNGYNIDLVSQGTIEAASPLTFVGGRITGGGSSLRAGYKLEIDGTPGNGLGRFPGCGDIDIAIRRINGVPANEYGDWLLIPEQCYWYERPSIVLVPGDFYKKRIVRVDPHTIQLHNNCLPCCECEDFVEVKLAMDSQYEDWLTTARRAERTRDIYRGNRERWITQKRCREDQPQRLQIEASCNSYVSVGYTYCNTSLDCVGPLEVKFCFETYGYSAGGPAVAKDITIAIHPNRTRKNNGISRRLFSYNMIWRDGCWWAYWDSLDAHTPGMIKFILRGCDAVDGDSIRVTATGTLAGVESDPVSELVAFEGACDSTDLCPTSESL